MIYQNQKLQQVLLIKRRLSLNMRKTVEILCWSSFFYYLLATALAFPKLMGMLIDCVKNKDNTQAIISP
jgi:hypothetical protein